MTEAMYLCKRSTNTVKLVTHKIISFLAVSGSVVFTKATMNRFEETS